jgi:membrane-bound serine protease (ClpP class)
VPATDPDVGRQSDPPVLPPAEPPRVVPLATLDGRRTGGGRAPDRVDDVDVSGRMPGARLRALIASVLLLGGTLMLAAGALVAPAAAQPGPAVGVTTVTGAITPVTEEHLGDTLIAAADQGLDALVVVLDTPGGLVASTRLIVQHLLDAPLPVIVYVAPSGADAGSAGTFITLAAHVAAMAPATTIGAATPVDLEGGEVGDKIVENAAAFAQAIAEERGRDVDFAVASVREGRSITASAALDEGVIDLIASDLTELLTALEGQQVDVRGEAVTLRTADATTVELEMTRLRQILQLLADPNVAFILLSLGTLAILYEIANPGLGLGGVIGVASLVLALFSLSVLPVNYAGAALVVLAAAMFIAELFMPGIGVGAAGGTLALLLGGLFLFQGESGIGVDWWVLIPTVGVAFGLALLAAVMVARTRGIRSRAGSDDLLGRETTVENAAAGEPRGKVGGSFWRLRPEDGAGPLRDGDRVTVVERRNLDLIVVPSNEHARRVATSDRPASPRRS